MARMYFVPKGKKDPKKKKFRLHRLISYKRMYYLLLIICLIEAYLYHVK